MLERAEADQLVALLGKCTPGNLPPDVFEAVGRVSVYPAVELVPVRMTENGIEVLLMQRPADDITWPSMLHTPGTILRPTDETVESAMARLVDEELQGTTILEPPRFLRYRMYNHTRGRGLGLEHIVVVGESTDGEFYSVHDLPEALIAEQIPTINYVAEVYSAPAAQGR
jgi:hypothetical protein